MPAGRRRDFTPEVVKIGPWQSLFAAVRVTARGTPRVRVWVRKDFSRKKRGRSQGLPLAVTNAEWDHPLNAQWEAA